MRLMNDTLVLYLCSISTLIFHTWHDSDLQFINRFLTYQVVRPFSATFERALF